MEKQDERTAEAAKLKKKTSKYDSNFHQIIKILAPNQPGKRT